jgi:hypothetical protein
VIGNVVEAKVPHLAYLPVYDVQMASPRMSVPSLELLPSSSPWLLSCRF